ncbi:MFS transporter, partial [Enterococcus faecalis]|uniref:MFS transporter n=1 Tax=Enterococcus faecalis TaxID=1351 RepID=UPI00403F664A
FLIALQFIPESPRFLVGRERDGEARGVLARLFGADAAERKVADIRASFARDHHPRLSDVLAPGTVLRPVVWAGLLLAVFQQFV